MDWWWIASELNPADLLTRPHDPSDVAVSPLWKYGPEFMTQHFVMLPISQSENCAVLDKIHVNLLQHSLDERPINGVKTEVTTN